MAGSIKSEIGKDVIDVVIVVIIGEFRERSFVTGRERDSAGGSSIVEGRRIWSGLIRCKSHDSWHRHWATRQNTLCSITKAVCSNVRNSSRQDRYITVIMTSCSVSDKAGRRKHAESRLPKCGAASEAKARLE